MVLFNSFFLIFNNKTLGNTDYIGAVFERGISFDVKLFLINSTTKNVQFYGDTFINS